MRLFYFTKLEHLPSILETGIRSSALESVNDPYEISAIKIYPNTKELIQLKDYPQIFNKRFICLSGSYNNSLMWAHYADKHKGVCLGIDIKDDDVCKVTYSESILEIYGKESLSLKDALSILTTKYKGWEYENEFRVFTNNIHEKFTPDFCLKEIMFGYKIDEYTSSIFKKYKLDHYKMNIDENYFNMLRVKV